MEGSGLLVIGAPAGHWFPQRGGQGHKELLYKDSSPFVQNFPEGLPSDCFLK